MNLLKWINTFAFLAMVGLNIAANTIPIGGNTTGEVSEAYPNLFTPAPITFAIWGVIYFLMLLFIVFQWGFIWNRSSSLAIRDEIGIAFTVSCIFNIAWIFAWHTNKIGLSTLLIVLLLLSLILITRRIGRTPNSLLTFLSVKLGFDIYFGWIIVATIANICVMLSKNNWNRFGLSEVFWTVLIIIVGALITSLVVFRDNRYFSGFAVIWAYVGIIIKHLSKTGYNGSYPLIILAAAIGIVTITITAIYRLFVPNPRRGVVSSLG